MSHSEPCVSWIAQEVRQAPSLADLEAWATDLKEHTTKFPRLNWNPVRRAWSQRRRELEAISHEHPRQN